MSKIVFFWRKLSPLTRSIFIFAFVNIILINFVLIEIFRGYLEGTLLDQVKYFLLFQQQFDDSWSAMLQAFNYTQTEHHEAIYSAIFFHQKIKFQYPLTSLLVFYPLKSIDSFLKAINLSWSNILTALSWLSIVVESYIVIRIFNLSLITNNLQKKNTSSIDIITRNILLACVSLTFYPVIKAFALGQIQAWVNCLFAMLFFYWMKRKKGVSGILAGIMCLIKPQYSIIFLWGILRKQWNFTLALITTVFAGFLISVSLFGLSNNIAYLSVMSFISRHGEIFYPNQSVNGLVNRLLFNGNSLIFDNHSFPPFNSYVYAITIISSIVLISAAFLLPTRVNERGSIVDLAIVALTCTIASPIAWEHHYGILLPIYAFLLPCLIKNRIFGRMTIPYCVISYLLISNDFFPIVNKLAHAQFNLNIVQSYLFFAGLMILICLYILRSKKLFLLNCYKLSCLTDKSVELSMNSIYKR